MFADLHTARGKGKVYVDGEYAATIDFYSSPIRYRQEVFDTGPLEKGIHTIGLEALWEKDERSTGYNVSFNELLVANVSFALTSVTAGPLVADEPVWATSPKDGMLYLVPEQTAATRQAIEAASLVTVGGTVYGARTTAVAATAAALDTSDFAPGLTWCMRSIARATYPRRRRR
jgi:hypothetical protein